MNNIFLISDTHFCHKKALEFSGREAFSSLEEMHQAIITRWNRNVGVRDTVYHLGDVFLGPAEEAKKLIQKLNGYKILIRGNHDTKSDHWYFDAGFEEVHHRLILPSPTRPGKQTYLLTHIPVPAWQILALESQYGTEVTNLHGHVHAVTDRAFTGDDIWNYPNYYRNFSCEKIDFTPCKVNF